MVNAVSLYLQVLIYVAAGINHFVHPRFYLRIIPPYLPSAPFINALSGTAEILLGLLLLVPQSRNLAALGIIAMLAAFIPAHIYLIQISKPGLGTMLAWLRMIPGQPLLIWWAYSLVNRL